MPTSHVTRNSSDASQLRADAEAAFRARDFPLAIDKFDALSELGDPEKYNDVARSKHGAALWRVADRMEAMPTKQLAVLDRAIALLQVASRHRDTRYAARSRYEWSKALWHRWRLSRKTEDLHLARDMAARAVSEAYEASYISWQEKVDRDVADLERQAAPPALGA